MFLFIRTLGLPLEIYSWLQILSQFFTSLIPFDMTLLKLFLVFDNDVQAFVLLASQSIR